MKILIADDSDVIRQRLYELLSDIRNIEIVGFAKSTSEAFTLIDKLKPDAMILDIHFTDGSGIDVLRYTKKFFPNIIITISTNFPYPQYKNECMKLGADFFLDKSIEFEKISDIFKELAE